MSEGRAVQVTSFDGLAGSRVIERPAPEPADGDVLVRMRVAAMHPLEALIAAGGIPFAKQPPLVLGAVGAGEALSDGASIKAGDRVAVLGSEMGMFADGVWADHAVVPERLLARVPDGLDIEVAACLGIAFPTALLALRHAAPKPGGTVLVIGASGAVGSAAVQMAARDGHRVVAVSRSAAGCAFASSLGAHETVDLSSESLADAGARLTNGGFDAIIDPVGGAVTAAALKVLGSGCAQVVLGYSAGFESTVFLPDIVNTAGRLQGANMYMDGPDGLRAAEDECLAGLAAGALRAPIAARFGLDEVNAAHAAATDPAVHGRILLVLER